MKAMGVTIKEERHDVGDPMLSFTTMTADKLEKVDKDKSIAENFGDINVDLP